MKTDRKNIKLCYEFRAFIRCMKAAFCGPVSKIPNVYVDQKTRPSICFKTRGRAFETLRRAFEILDRAFESLRKNQSSVESFRSSAECLCHNTACPAPTSHDTFCHMFLTS